MRCGRISFVHRALLLTAAIGLLGGAGVAHGVVPGQVDDFQDGTLANWGGGATLTNVSTGGPGGVGDRFLRVAASGGFGPGSRIGTNNGVQWRGDYWGNRIVAIGADMANFGATTLQMRVLLLFGAGGNFTSTNPVLVPADGQWRRVRFGLCAGELTYVGGGTNDLSATLSDLPTLMIRHQVGAPAGPGGATSVVGNLGIDNIRAIPLIEWVHSVTAHKTGPGAFQDFFVDLDLSGDPLLRTIEPRDSGIKVIEVQFGLDVASASVNVLNSAGTIGGGPFVLGPGANGPMSLGRIDLGGQLPNDDVYTLDITTTLSPGCSYRTGVCVGALAGDFNNDGAVTAADKAELLGFVFQPITQLNAKYDLQVNGGDSGIIEVGDVGAWTGFFGTSVSEEECP